VAVTGGFFYGGSIKGHSRLCRAKQGPGGLSPCDMARIIVGIPRKKPENKAAKNTKTVRPWKSL
jgi:hypothetical protein